MSEQLHGVILVQGMRNQEIFFDALEGDQVIRGTLRASTVNKASFADSHDHGRPYLQAEIEAVGDPTISHGFDWIAGSIAEALRLRDKQ